MFGEYRNFFIHQWVVGQDNSEGIHIAVLRYNKNCLNNVMLSPNYSLTHSLCNSFDISMCAILELLWPTTSLCELIRAAPI